jgi:hypothetical protein
MMMITRMVMMVRTIFLKKRLRRNGPLFHMVLRRCGHMEIDKIFSERRNLMHTNEIEVTKRGHQDGALVHTIFMS